VPSLRVVGCVAACLSGVAWPLGGRVCYRLVSELLVETPGRYGSGLLVRVSWLRSNSDREVENLRRNGIAESTQELERHRSFVRVRRIVTILFEFGSDRHCGIKRDPGSLDRRAGEQGSSDESEAKVKSQPSDCLERDRWPGGIAGNQVTWELIPQGGPAIQTMVSLRGYVSASEELWGERRVTPNRRCMPPQIERH
jgi:hypothetical protein